VASGSVQRGLSAIRPRRRQPTIRLRRLTCSARVLYTGATPLSLETVGAIVGIVGGLVGIPGGIAGLIARYRPPKLEVSYSEYLGVVVSQTRTTSKLHLPLSISNMSNKPGMITHIALRVTPASDSKVVVFRWDRFWREHEDGNRTPERRPIPIPIPALNNAERNVQFECLASLIWRSETYRFDLEIKAGRGKTAKQVSSFYIHPSESRCKSWYEGPRLPNAWVDEVPIYPSLSFVPDAGD